MPPEKAGGPGGAGRRGVESNSVANGTTEQGPDQAANPRLEEALRLAGLGFRVVALYEPLFTGEKPGCSCSKPITCKNVGKHPRYDHTTLAHGANSGTTNPGVIRSWWEKWPSANVGLCTGSGIIAIDIDPRNGGDATWAALEDELGPFPRTAEARTGGGGRHLLAVRPDGVKARGSLGPGVEVQDEGKHIVVAPSLHPSGNTYTWKPGQALGEVDVAELPEAWKRRVFLGGDRDDRDDRDDRENRAPPPDSCAPSTPCGPCTPCPPCPPCGGWDEDRVLAECRVTARGQHDIQNMKLARGAKLNLGFANPEAARPLFDRWFEQAKPHLNEQNYDDCWFKFLRGFDRARIPLGKGNIADEAWALALRRPPPKCADRVRSDQMRQVVSLCYQMHLLVGGPFKLSCHQLGRIFGVQHTVAYAWLRGLQQSLILQCVDRGRPGRPGQGAATFRFIGDALEGNGRDKS